MARKQFWFELRQSTKLILVREREQINENFLTNITPFDKF